MSDSLDAVALRSGIPSDSIAYWYYGEILPMHELGFLATWAFLGGPPGGPTPDHHHKWLNQMAADFLAYAGVILMKPEMADLYEAFFRAAQSSMDVPPGNRKGLALLEQCDSAFGEISVEWAIGWCGAWWTLRAVEIYHERGFQFLRDLDTLVPWPDPSHPYPTVEEMLTALDMLEPGWMVWVPTEDDELPLPSVATLHQNYPNPFSHTTAIRYSLDQPAFVRLAVNDVLGRSVRVLVDAPRPPGEHLITLNASELPPGLYLYRLNAGSHTVSRTMVVER